MTIVSTGSKTLSAYLKDSCYYIPEYQRGYSWDENQFEDLWMDLMHLYIEEVGGHFYGQIVIHNDEIDNKKYIIDGQQRTSTAVILLDAFRTVYRHLFIDGKEDAKFEIEDLTTIYIGRTSDKRFEPRLFLSDADRGFFTENIQKENKIEYSTNDLLQLKKSESLIVEAGAYFEQKLYEFIGQFQDPEAQYREIKHLLSLFLNNFTVLTIETGDINQAFILFETLNARGKDLAISDLLKNHVFRISEDSIADAKVAWDDMITTLDEINPTKFIRHYWNAQYKFVRERDLYGVIRKTINSPPKVKDLMGDLVSLSKLYAALNRPQEVVYFNDNVLIEQNKEINSLGAQSYYPIIMALVLKKYSEEDIIAIHSVIESFIVRNFTVSGKTANRSEKNFAGIAQRIAQNELENADAIIAAVNNLIIRDEEFYENFKLFEVKKGGTIRYLLRKIHNHLNVETRIIADNQTIHIEHIMPKIINHADEWNIDADQHENYLNRFGNLTLLGQEYNRSAVNKDFESKKEIYQESEIPMTQELTEYQTWTVDDIEERQKELANLALWIWKKE